MVVIKVHNSQQNDLRRISLPDETTYIQLRNTLKSLFGGAALPQRFLIKYKDEEGDFLSITSEIEFAEAKKLNPNMLRLTIVPPSTEKITELPKTEDKTEEKQNSKPDLKESNPVVKDAEITAQISVEINSTPASETANLANVQYCYSTSDQKYCCPNGEQKYCVQQEEPKYCASPLLEQKYCIPQEDSKYCNALPSATTTSENPPVADVSDDLSKLSISEQEKNLEDVKEGQITAESVPLDPQAPEKKEEAPSSPTEPQSSADEFSRDLYSVILDQLAEMGYTDTRRNLALAKKYRGDVVQCLEELLN
jgi:hypothetical protein